jgi:hypothetical protein
MAGGKGLKQRGMRINQAKRYRAKGNKPAVFIFGDAYELSDECLADVKEAASPLDLPVGAYPPDRGHGRILDVSKTLGIRLGRGSIKSSRRHLSESLMRPMVVVDSAKIIAPVLLSLRISSRRSHGILFQSTMKPLMSTVLLGMTGVNALRHDAQLDPPHGQRRQSAGSYRGKGRAIVGADGQRQTVLLKDPLKRRLHMGIVRSHNLAAKEHTGAGIGYGERVAASSIASAYPPFEVSTPDTIRLIGPQKRLKPGAGSPAVFTPTHQTMDTQYPASRAHARPLFAYLRVCFRPRQQLGWTPGWMRLLCCYQSSDHFGRRGPGLNVRSSRKFIKSRNTSTRVARQLLMSGLPANSKLLRNLGYRIFASLKQGDQFESLFHRTGFLPRQGSTSSPPSYLLPM